MVPSSPTPWPCITRRTIASGPRPSRPKPRVRSGALAALLLLVVCATAAAQSPDNVLLVTNQRSAVSTQIGAHYVQARGLSPENVLEIAVEPTEQVTRSVYEKAVELPVAKWLSQHAAQDRILYIVLTKDIPLRVAGTGGRTGTIASVDSELTLLY